MAKIIELIESEHTWGKGSEDDPYRVRAELWTKDGLLILMHDPHTDRVTYLGNVYVRAAFSHTLAECGQPIDNY